MLNLSFNHLKNDVCYDNYSNDIADALGLHLPIVATPSLDPVSSSDCYICNIIRVVSDKS